MTKLLKQLLYPLLDQILLVNIPDESIQAFEYIVISVDSSIDLDPSSERAARFSYSLLK